MSIFNPRELPSFEALAGGSSRRGRATSGEVADWIFVDQIDVAAVTGRVLFGAGGDGELGTALDGDVDEVYLLEAMWLTPNSNDISIQLCPNNTAINTDSETTIFYGIGGPFQGATEYTSLIFGRTHSGPEYVCGEIMLYATAGKVRSVGDYIQGGSAVGHPWLNTTLSGVWTNTDPITSLAIATERLGVAQSSIQANSRFRLYKRGLPT